MSGAVALVCLLIVEQLFDMQNVNIQPVLFKLFVEVRTDVVSKGNCNARLEP